LQLNTLPPALQRIGQIVALQVNRQAVIQHQLARRLGQFNLLRPGHQR
jgi:formylmethanofuran:tetrahydromethanopterin formyltransferase